MTKEDLNHGNVVVLRNGVKCFCYKIVESKFIYLEKPNAIYFDYYNENLTYNRVGFEEYDVMKVYKDHTCEELLWERKEKPKLTEDEKVILRNIDKKYKWIARDKRDNLSVFVGEPIKLLAVLSWGEEDCEEKDFPFDDLFQFIKWEDNRPYNIRDLLEEDESK